MADGADHAHETDRLYQPLTNLSRWAAVEVDEAAWRRDVARLAELRAADPDWFDMVTHGALLAAAHQSAALDGMHAVDPAITLRLLSGVAKATDPHTRANYDALGIAVPPLTEPLIRRVHAVACWPQLTHRVHDHGRDEDHVLAHGDYKHHPNHAPGQVFAPVTAVPFETARIVEMAASPAFAALHPVTQAAFAHDAVLHVGPFADGNGRVARALASAYLLAVIGVPLLVTDEVTTVERCAHDLVDLLVQVRAVAGADPVQVAALDRWRGEAAAAAAVRAALSAAVGGALDRHRRRTDLGFLSALPDAEVRPGDPLIISGPSVDEVLRTDVHPLAGDGPVLRADAARLHLDLSRGMDRDQLAGWLDRVVSTLALRVAAEAD